MRTKLRIYVLLIGLVFLLTGIVVADQPQTVAAKPAEDPVVMLKEVTSNVLNALSEHERRDPDNLKGIYSLVDRYILPHVDFDEMSLWVAGRTVWGKASDKTREEFVDAFKVLVVRTYATALNNYTNEKVVFGTQTIDPAKQRIQISSTVVRQGKDSVKLDYRLVKHEDKWYVYDVIIEGVSILQGFQAQFSDQIRQDGLQKVIAQIQEHNREKNA